MNKKKTIIKAAFAILLLVLSMPTVHAFDFSTTSATGQVLYYDIITDSTVSVTYPNHVGNSYYSGFSMPSGNLLIPSSVTHLSVSYQVVRVGSHAFDGCTSLSSVIVPNTVNSISDHAFSGCSGLFSVHVSQPITTINDYAFSGCTSLTSFALPESVTMLGVGAFQGCSAISSLSLNNNLSVIGNLAFDGCASLVTVSIPNSVMILGNWAFNNCTALDTLFLGTNITSIQQYAFSGCTHVRYLSYNCKNATAASLNTSHLPLSSLIQAEIGDSVTNLTAYAFAGASHLQYLYLGTSLAAIGGSVFSGCDSLSQVSVRRSVPPTINSTTFSSYSATLIVPCLSETDYQVATYWSSFDSVDTFYPYRATTSSNDILRGYVTVTQLPTCTNPYAQIQASSYPGYHFLHWDDGDTTNPRMVGLTADQTFEAFFVSDYSSITCHSNDTSYGIVAGSGIYMYLTQASLQAIPHNGYHFVAWSDGVTANPRTILVNQDSSFTADFAPNIYSISVLPQDSVMGNVSGMGNYAFSTTAILSAQAYYGYHFVQWSDGVTANPRSIVVTSDSTITALFSPNEYLVEASTNDSLLGQVLGGGYFPFHSLVRLEAVAAPHNSFVQWSDGVTDNPRSILLTSDTSISAIFAPVLHLLTCVSNDNELGVASQSGYYHEGDPVVISAAAQPHCHFVTWSDGISTNPRVVVLTSDTLFTAIFEVNPQYEIQVYSNNSDLGAVTGSGRYYYAEEATIQAIPQGEHIVFYSWDDGATDNPRTVQVVADASYTALFGPELIQLDLVSNSDDLGLVYGAGNYPYGTSVTVLAVPSPDASFLSWSDGIVDNPRTLLLTSDVHLQANFVLDNGSLSVGSPDCNMVQIAQQHLSLHITTAGQQAILVYDLQGRLIAQSANGQLLVTLPQQGLYVVKVGSAYVQKVIAF